MQTVTAAQLAAQHSLDLSSYLGDAVGSVHVNDVQSNPLQPDLQYRGFLASPLLGAPQGLSMYLDGVRLNEPFGDTINWDLIPANAIGSVNVMPGSNPIFGLNTLGGALSIETKNGFSDDGRRGQPALRFVGTEARARERRRARRPVRHVRGGAGPRRERLAPALADQRRSRRSCRPRTGIRARSADLTLLAANTSLTGNGASPEQLLATDRRAVFTSPDNTKNQMFMAVLRGERPLAPQVALSGHRLRADQSHAVGERRSARLGRVHGDGGRALLDRRRRRRDARCWTGNGNPVAFSDAYNAALNRTDTRQTSFGASAQLAVGVPLVGARESSLRRRDRGPGPHPIPRAIDRRQPDRRSRHDRPRLSRSGVTGGGRQRGQRSRALRQRHVRCCAAPVPVGVGPARTCRRCRCAISSATISPAITRFIASIPPLGLSYQPRPWLGGYFGYSESSRAPTAIELTCASPTAPCRLPNAFVADPPLNQVVARTFELGVRGALRRGAASRSLRRDRRFEPPTPTTSCSSARAPSPTRATSRTWATRAARGSKRALRAPAARGRARARSTGRSTTRSPTPRSRRAFAAPSATHPDAVNGAIDVPAGAHIPSIPAHSGKVVVGWSIAVGLSRRASTSSANSSQYLRGDEANLLAPVPGFVVVGARVGLSDRAAGRDRSAGEQPPRRALLDVRSARRRHRRPGSVVHRPRFLGPGGPRAAWLELDLRY